MQRGGLDYDKEGGDGGSRWRGPDVGEEAPGREGSMGRRRPCSLEPEDAEAMTRDLARLARQEHVMTRQKGMMGKRSWRGRRRPIAVRLGAEERGWRPWSPSDLGRSGAWMSRLFLDEAEVRHGGA